MLLGNGIYIHYRNTMYSTTYNTLVDKSVVYKLVGKKANNTSTTERPRYILTRYTQWYCKQQIA